MALKDVPRISPAHLRIPPPPSFGTFSRKSADWSSGAERGRSGHVVSGNRRPQTELTIVIVGATRVGKSAIVNQFLHGIFQEEYKETVDDMHWIEYDATAPSAGPPGVTSPPPMEAPKEEIRRAKSKAKSKESLRQNPSSNTGIFLLKIIDASGSREFLGMRKLYEQQGDAFLLVVAIDDPDSFEEAKVIRKEIGERNRKNAPVSIVLNKIDLLEEPNFKCRVDSEEVQEFASETKSLFIEATATKYESVTEIFQQLLEHHSSIPSTAELKYRRKSVPVSMTVHDFAPFKGGSTGGSMNSHRSRVGTFSDHSKDIPEENEQVEEKRPSCVIG